MAVHPLWRRFETTCDRVRRSCAGSSGWGAAACGRRRRFRPARSRSAPTMCPRAWCTAPTGTGCAAHYQARGTDSKSAADYVREFRAFFEAGPEDLWITFDRGHLWWAFGVTQSRAIRRVSLILNNCTPCVRQLWPGCRTAFHMTVSRLRISRPKPLVPAYAGSIACVARAKQLTPPLSSAMCERALARRPPQR